MTNRCFQMTTFKLSVPFRSSSESRLFFTQSPFWWLRLQVSLVGGSGSGFCSCSGHFYKYKNLKSVVDSDPTLNSSRKFCQNVFKKSKILVHKESFIKDLQLKVYLQPPTHPPYPPLPTSPPPPGKKSEARPCRANRPIPFCWHIFFVKPGSESTQVELERWIQTRRKPLQI